MMKKKNSKIECNLTAEDFKAWVKTAEISPRMSIEEFNKKWKEKELKIKEHFGFI
nr:hypothetical protein [uncultured Flavobacterium sp.]